MVAAVVPADPATTAATTAPASDGNGQAGPRFAHRQILEIVATLVVCQFVSSLSQTVISTALPTIVGDLGGQNQLAWVASAQLLATTVSTPLWGKLSDLYGRKPLMQTAIVLFTVTSAFAGLSQSMGQLIASRAGQGVGIGGIIALSQAILGDIVSPRERGRYSGYLGASFGIATVGGPLIGGFLVDGPGWRWCFYVGLPIAVCALVVLARVLHLPVVRRKARIDWGGAVLLTSAAGSLLLLLSLGGQEFAWLSGWTVLLGGICLVTLVATVVVERRVADPVLPPRLFRGRTFDLTGIASFFTGVALFGVMIYVPQYLQVVRGKSPTVSGLLTLPLVVGMLTASILSGRAITRWGRWKAYPIAGLIAMTAGAGLLSTLQLSTNFVAFCGYLLVFGVGLGLTMQVLILAVQNTVERRDLGIATSVSTFFRSMGGAVGVSLFGALLSARLDAVVPAMLADRGLSMPAGGLTGQLGTPAQIAALHEPLRSIIRTGFAVGLDRVYLVTIPLIVVSLLAVIAVREVPLRRH